MSPPVDPQRAVAGFDSATASLRALARFLHGRDVPLLGAASPRMEAPMRGLAGALSRLPAKVREEVFTLTGASEALPAKRLAKVDSGRLAEWITEHYPDRRYPAVLVGASNGAAAYLAALLGVPWLPGTLLLPVRTSGLHPDEPRDAADAAREAAEALLAANPDLALHQMHDPNQDRLMIRRMAYFRVKRLRLGDAYERFLDRALLPGGTIVLLDCRLTWPVARLGERHTFQHGAVGGATVQEYHEGGPRVAEFLGRYGSHRRRWDPPEPNEEVPEAEWGLEPRFAADAERFASARGYMLKRLTFDTPDQLSPAVADLYRDWYARCGLPTDRLLVSSFVHLEPYWAMRTASVPYWSVFNTQPSCDSLTRYLKDAEPYDEIRMTLFSHGVESIGLAGIQQWRATLGMARKLGSFVGVDEDAYPRDFASAVRYHGDLARIRARFPLPPPLPMSELPTRLPMA